MEIKLGSYGTHINITVMDESTSLPLNISSATVKKFVFILPTPARREVIKTASFTTDGSDGKLSYVIAYGDLTVSGDWEVYAYVESTPYNGNTSSSFFTVVN